LLGDRIRRTFRRNFGHVGCRTWLVNDLRPVAAPDEPR
jgi:hypothetical protein